MLHSPVQHSLWLSVIVLLMMFGLLCTDASADAGDPLPRIQCPAIYTATIYAEGLSSPDGLAFSPDGMLYVAEEAAGRVSRVEPFGSVTLILSGLNHPEGIAFDEAGNLYVVEDVPESASDPARGRLVKMTTDGVTTTLATDLDAPEGVVWVPDGTAYITESNVQFTSNPLQYRTRVTAISSGGEVTPILTSLLSWSYAGITVGSDGSLYVTNEASGIDTQDSIFIVDPITGSRTLFASNLVSPEGLRFSANGGFPLYVVEEDTGEGAGRLSQVQADGSHLPFCTGFHNIEDVVLDRQGRLYVSEDTTGSIIRIEPDPPNRAHPRAIILLIGDGMGEAHRAAARWSEVGQNGALAMDPLPYGGCESTSSADNPVTDSAAAATALATGVKTNNGVIGMDPGLNPLTTILERAQARGMAVGLVTNVQMSHATPAAFAAHVDNRNNMTEIAAQMLDTEVDVLLGGGEDEFLPITATGCYTESGERTDGRNLISEAVALDYTYVCDAADLTAVNPMSTTRLLGLFADEGMGRPFSPSLVEMTQKAIAVLSQDPDGFFLMVEGGQIDWASHANDAVNTITDTADFDQAVAAARTYATTAEDTLIIVTADHETGGMSVSLTSTGVISEDGPFHMPGGTHFYVNWTSGEHTSADVPTTAQGPWSDLLIGAYENTHIHDVMRMALESAPFITLTQVAAPPSGSVVRPGDRITYTLTLTNSGTADANGLTLTDTLPADVAYVPGSARTSPGLNITALPPPALVLTGTLRAGSVATATFDVTVSVVPSDTLLINHIKTVTGGPGLVTSAITHSVVATPNLVITKTVTPANGSFVEPGDRITYTVVAHNSGGLAHDVVLSDTLDLANVTLVFSHTTDGSLSGPNPVQVTSLDMDSGQRVTLTLGVTVIGEVSGTLITNQASLTSTETPSPLLSHRVTHVISHTEIVPPSFVLTKTANPPDGSFVEPGDWITYTIVAHNSGGPAHAVVLSDVIPTGTAYVLDSAITNLGEISFDGTHVRLNVLDLPAGWVLTASFCVTVTTNATTITNVALLTSAQTGLEHSNSVIHPTRGTEPHRIYLPVLLNHSGTQRTFISGLARKQRQCPMRRPHLNSWPNLL